MNRIRLLSEQVANQIAAGEVVERPASVVKELVENSLDAQATRITVEIQAGGRSLIRVTDDGAGMSRDDALLCLERHATSKIQKAEDLAAIATMGFRGEALPSIASVSRFTLTTREREVGVQPSGCFGSTDSLKAELQPIEGTQVIVNGGKIVEVKAAGSAPGTSVEVRQLFFNLPARRKFLRSEETESAHIQHYLTLAALAYPEVAFTFQKDGRLVWQLPALKSGQEVSERLPVLRERLRAIHGGDQKMLAVDFSTEVAEPVESTGSDEPSTLNSQLSTLRVRGFIGAPGVSRSTREDQHLFVNRRPVENRGLNFALLEGYHTALMKGRYPVCCLFLEIDPAAVDVNIHPSKREVKFHQEAVVRRLVAQAVRETLLRFHSGTTAEDDTRSRESKVEGRTPERVTAVGRTLEVKPTPEFSAPQLPNFPLPAKPVPEWPARPVETRPLPMGFSSVRPTPAPSTPAPTQLPDHPITQSPVSVPLLNVPLRLVGVIGKLYVVLESDRGLVLLDQHAAHERILFEQMLTRLEQQGNASSQRLLLPETVELSVRDAQFLREQLTTLTRLGVGLSEFGERTFLLDALPPFVKAPDARRFVLELVDELKAAGQEVNSLRLGEHTVAKTVCRHAVKANDPLRGRELENLVEDLRRCAMPYTCPHGRPTLIEMNYRELEKKFGRTQ
ncbi:MAG: DNA mismatch repair endonuclease MutL [Verrucomicrobia bacterium]|nr:DNA mismatch repair endonuclease MutL [Verrucomicrobiota bacterium]